jgi:1,4-alpha-glucan branching enzyme
MLVLLVACLAAGCSTISRSVKDRLPPPKEVEGGILFRYEAPAARMVTLAGNFNNWAGTQGGGRYDPTIDPMMDDDGDGVWEIVKPLPPGRYQYKFVIDNGVRWEKDPSNPNTGIEGGIENSLLIVSEGVNYKWEVVTGTVLPGQLVRSSQVGEREVGEPREADFELDAPFAGEVFLAGDFNDWSPTENPMAKGDDGIWRTTLTLIPGTYEYKFVVDGEWIEDPENPDFLPDPYGGKNSVITVE